MRVLFDVSCLDHEKISGIGTYARHLLAHLGQRRGLEINGSWRLSRHKRLRWIRGNCSIEISPYIPLWSSFNFAGYDVFHGPDFRVPYAARFPRVSTVHDLAFYHEGYHSQEFARKKRQMVDGLLRRARPEAVIAVSEFTRQEIIQNYPEYENRVFTCYHGADHLLVPTTRGIRPFAFPYFLFCGNIEHRKNLHGILSAFENLKAHPAFNDIRLVLIGKAGFGFKEILEHAQKLKYRDHVIFGGFITNMGLVDYYQYAEAFVFPSHYEGFGFPILEAMRLGCPVITSSTSAAGEIAGDAALKVDPDNSDAITSAMVQILEKPEISKSLRERGLRRGAEFTWKACAERTEEIYNKAIANPI